MSKLKFSASLALLATVVGCSTMENVSKQAGTVGTQVVGTVAVGAGTAIACDKATDGKHRGACLAAGAAAGILAGKLLADLDAKLEKATPTVRCSDTQKKLRYKASDTTQKANIRVAFAPKSAVYRPGELIKPTVFIDLAAPEGKEIPIRLQIDDMQSEKVQHKECGGDYKLPVEFDKSASEQSGAQYINVSLLNTETNSVLARTKACYTVASDGKDQCDAAKGGKSKRARA